MLSCYLEINFTRKLFPLMTDFYCCLYILPDIVLVDYDNFEIREEFYDKKTHLVLMSRR